MSMLAGIAKGMKQRLAPVQKGVITKPLFGGLIIVFERRNDTWRLAIGRTGAAPSKTEAELVGAAFAVPAGAEWHWTARKNPKKRLTYQVAEVTWIERLEPTNKQEDTPTNENSSDLQP